jgi:hypothetical protein
MALDAIQAEYQSVAEYAEMLIGYGLVLFAIAFFSQFFHDNYLGYIVTVLALAWLVAVDRAIPEVTP